VGEGERYHDEKAGDDAHELIDGHEDSLGENTAK
jgi:hypothetical protein